MNITKNTINFTVGMILGVIGSVMWQYDKFLYYTVFCLQAIIIFILINSPLQKEQIVKENSKISTQKHK